MRHHGQEKFSSYAFIAEVMVGRWFCGGLGDMSSAAPETVVGQRYQGGGLRYVRFRVDIR